MEMQLVLVQIDSNVIFPKQDYLTDPLKLLISAH